MKITPEITQIIKEQLSTEGIEEKAFAEVLQFQGFTVHQHLDKITEKLHKLHPDELEAVDYRLCKLRDLIDEIQSTEVG